MEAFTSFARDFGAVINFVALVAVFLFLYRGLRATVDSKDATIQLLLQRIELAKTCEVGNANQKIRELKEWYENSNQQLEAAKERALEKNATEYLDWISEEMKSRAEVWARYSQGLASSGAPGYIPNMTDSVCGEYSISGRNHTSPNDDPSVTWDYGHYSGFLTITGSGQVYDLIWRIGIESLVQKWEGTGVLSGSTLSVCFKQATGDQKGRYGLISYDIVNPDVMRGLWTFFRGRTCGSEECRKMGDIDLPGWAVVKPD
ncbi:MAG: ATP synthase F0 subunit B [bacterium]|nr:ATP synthase F0 subunit B [bacterium]